MIHMEMGPLGFHSPAHQLAFMAAGARRAPGAHPARPLRSTGCTCHGTAATPFSHSSFPQQEAAGLRLSEPPAPGRGSCASGYAQRPGRKACGTQAQGQVMV